MQIVVDSLLTHYTVSGTGKVVVLLHGWGDSGSGMHSIQQELSATYKVYAIDLPGFGGSQSPTSTWDLTAYATHIQHFLAKVDAGPVWAIIGHSNGGAMAVRGIAQGLLQAERVILLASAGIRNVYKGRVRALRVITKFGKALTMPLPTNIKKRLRKTVYSTVGSDMLVAEHLQETFKKVVTDDVQVDAVQLTMPVLLVYGEQDESTPVWYGQQFHELMVDSTLLVVPDAGHFVHMDKPDVVRDAITEHLR